MSSIITHLKLQPHFLGPMCQGDAESLRFNPWSIHFLERVGIIQCKSLEGSSHTNKPSGTCRIRTDANSKGIQACNSWSHILLYLFLFNTGQFYLEYHTCSKITGSTSHNPEDCLINCNCMSGKINTQTRQASLLLRHTQIDRYSKTI